jgi:heme exporter protein D
MEKFFSMGGYGGFVWPAYAIAGSVLAVLLAASLRRLRRVRRELDSLDRAGER